MPESKVYRFYLWRHRFIDDATDEIIARTCFGITSNLANRQQNYEGHVGHVIRFAAVWTGPERLIRELEAKIKSDFYDHVVIGTNGFRYEWIREDVEFETVRDWVRWEVDNSFTGITEETLVPAPSLDNTSAS